MLVGSGATFPVTIFLCIFHAEGILLAIDPMHSF